MKATANLLKTAACAAMLLAAFPAQAGMKEGVAAYRAGDYETAYREFSELAKAGDANGQFNLAVLYLSGRGVERDTAKAVDLHLKAARQGMTAAEHGLGLLYYQGVGVAKDYGEALKWFRRAAAKGFAESQFNLGAMYFNRQGVKRDDMEVVKWVSLAAARKFGPAQYRLGQMYEKGVILSQNRDEALHWYTRAASNGSERGKHARERLTRAPDLPTVRKAPDGEKKDATGGAKAASPKATPEKTAAKTEEKSPRKAPEPAAEIKPRKTAATSRASPKPKRKPAPQPEPAAKPKAEATPPAPVARKPVIRSDGWKNPFSLAPPPRPAAASASDVPATPKTALEDPAPAPALHSPETGAPQIAPSQSASAAARRATGAREWRVQFGSYRSEEEADRAWTRLNRQAADAIGNTPRVIVEADLGDRGVFHRLQAGPLPNRSAASDFCAEIRTALPLQGCLPVLAPRP